MSNSKNWIIISLALFIIILIYTIRSLQHNDLKANGILVKVEVLEVLTGAKGSRYYNFKCKLNYNGRIKILFSPTNITNDVSRFVGKKVLAIFSPVNDNLRVLINREDYEEFNIPLTDSLIEMINSYH